MRDGATKEFVQAYNAQAAVDSHAQVIVATQVTQAANDVQQLVPMFERVHANTGQWPAVGSADAGYFSEAIVTAAVLSSVDLYVPPDKQSHGPSPASPAEHTPALARGRASSSDPAASAAAAPPSPPPSARAQMRAKVRTPDGHALYKMRKAIVEPVFGQTKERRGFRRFALRGLANVRAEWDLICLTHNVLKLFRAGGRLIPV